MRYKLGVEESNSIKEDAGNVNDNSGDSELVNNRRDSVEGQAGDNSGDLGFTRKDENGYE